MQSYYRVLVANLYSVRVWRKKKKKRNWQRYLRQRGRENIRETLWHISHPLGWQMSSITQYISFRELGSREIGTKKNNNQTAINVQIHTHKGLHITFRNTNAVVLQSLRRFLTSHIIYNCKLAVHAQLGQNQFLTMIQPQLFSLH